MERTRLPKSLRKFVRLEKARIRREVLDFGEQEKQIQQLYRRFFKNSYENTGNLQSGDK